MNDIHLTIDDDYIIEEPKLFERIRLICNWNNHNIPVEIPIIKMSILRDRVKPYLKERGLTTPQISMNSVVGFISRKNLKSQIQLLIHMINENVNEISDLKEVVMKFLELVDSSHTTNVQYLTHDKMNVRSGNQRDPKKTNMIPREDTDDVRSALQSEWNINFNELNLIRRAGEGAFGVIYKARYRGTYVAVKKFHVSEISPEILQEMKYEVSVLSGVIDYMNSNSKLRHPNIVLYIGASLEPPNVGMVTEWCEHGSLSDFLHDFSQPLFGRKLIKLALGISQGMEYLQGHHNRIIHRDLKSENVLLDSHYEAKVADFGLTVVQGGNTDQVVTCAQPTQKEKDPSGTVTMRMSLRNMLTNPITINGDVIQEDEGDFYGCEGTMQWMAPEIMNGYKYNSKVDIYSYGILLTELLSRIVPYSDEYSGFDFINDVITNNKLPTIPQWINCYENDPLYKKGWDVISHFNPKLEYINISQQLYTLIRQCTIMNARFRPSFKDLTEHLLYYYEISPFLILHSMDIPRIRYNLQNEKFECLAAVELIQLLTHILVPCLTCSEEIFRDRPIFASYVEVFIPEFMRLVGNIIHKQISSIINLEQKNESKSTSNINSYFVPTSRRVDDHTTECSSKKSILSLAIDSLLVLLRYFCIPDKAIVTSILKDIVMVLALYPALEEEKSNRHCVTPESVVCSVSKESSIECQNSSATDSQGIISSTISQLCLSMRDVCNMCIAVNMCWTQYHFEGVTMGETAAGRDGFGSLLNECFQDVKHYGDSISYVLWSDLNMRVILYKRLCDWIPDGLMIDVIISSDELKFVCTNNSKMKNDMISESVKNHIILLQNKFLLRLQIQNMQQ